MQYAAFQARHDGNDFSFTGRDELTGILGTYSPGDAAPLATADTLEELKERARALLGAEPDASLYLTDADGHVYGILTNEKHHEATTAANRRTAIAVALLVFCTTCLVAAALGFPAWWALLAFVGIGALYGVTVRAGLFNECESATTCEIMLILGLLMLAFLRGALER